MLGGLLSPFMPYIIGAVGIAALGLFGYVTLLRKQKANLQNQLALAEHANKTNVKTIEDLFRQNNEYRAKLETALKVDAKTEAEKQAAIDVAKKVVGEDSDALTQADIDAINKASKKGK